MTTSTVAWLEARGVAPETCRKIATLSVSELRQLLLSDYERFGIHDRKEKQNLFKALQMVEGTPPGASAASTPQLTPQPSGPGEDDLVDLDDDDFLTQDLDLEGFTHQAFVLSPAPSVAGQAQTGTLQLSSLPDAPKIRVIVRKRPLNKKELERGENDVLECDAVASCLYVNEPKVKVDLTKYVERHTFRFDDVFDERVDNNQLYMQAVQPLVGTIFRGGKGTCFAYGQTGSGKTYTMSPLPLRAAADIFSIMTQPGFTGLALNVSCYEIYGGKVFDLLNGRKKLEVREDGRRRVQVVGLREVEIGTLEVLQQLCDHSASARSTGSTGANDESSRSHSILCFALRRTGDATKMVGKLSFIDLAGSERGADTYDNDKQTRLEGAEINKSLLALKECIRALDADARHIPFRGSKLTEVLRDSFVGKNARTVMIANVSPNSGSCEHTLNTLRYADRVKEIRKPGTASGPAPNGQQSSMDLSQAQNESANLGVFQPAAAQPAVFQPAAAQPGVFQPAPTQPGVFQPAPTQPGVFQPAPTQPAVFQPAPAPVQQPAAVPALDVPPPAGAVPAQRQRSASAALFSSRSGSRYPSKRDGSGIPAVPAAAAVASVQAAPASQQPFVPQPVQPAAASWLSSAQAVEKRQAPPATADQQQSRKWEAAAPATQLSSSLDDVLGAIMAAEDDLITTHRQHIEDCMGAVREEMNLLANLDGSTGGGDIERYCADLTTLLAQKQASLSQLQLRLHAFQQLLRNAKQNT